MPVKKKKEWEVYIIQTQSNKLYTGITTNLPRRFLEHQGNQRGAKFFRTSQPEKILFREKHKNRSSATTREVEIKRMTRAEKLQLIQGQTEGVAASHNQSSKSN